MPSPSITLLKNALEREEQYFILLQQQISEGYKTLRLSISERNKTITKLANLENSIAILEEAFKNEN